MSETVYITSVASGEQFGPYSEDDMIALVRQGSFQGSDLAWKEGMVEWLPLQQMFPVLRPAMPAPPPVSAAMLAGARQQTAPQQQSGTSDVHKQIMFEAQKKSAGLACFLNFLVPGVGYMYAGRAFLGILVLGFWVLMVILGFVTLGLTFFVAALVWFVGLIDAFLAVNRANKRLAQRVLAG